MNLRRIIALTSVAVGLTSAPLPAATQQSAVMATVHQFIDGLNRGDSKTALAACATQASIIDEFPPHEWHGPAACADWAAAYAAEAKKDGITDGIVTLGQPWYLAVTGDRAYVVVPATYAYEEHGKPVTERDSIFTVALRKSSMGWRITGWAWSKH
ncbi:MAG: nuclear transport factor 2 family protein [Candidatus Cybelea sp.]